MSCLFTSAGQSIVASASTSVLPMNIQDWFPLGWAGFVSLQSKGLSRVFSNTVGKHQFFGAQPSLWSNSHIHTRPLEKSQLWLYGPLSAKWRLCFWICRLGLPCFPFKARAPSNLLAAATVPSDLGAQENKIRLCFPLLPLLFSMKWLGQMPRS